MQYRLQQAQEGQKSEIAYFDQKWEDMQVDSVKLGPWIKIWSVRTLPKCHFLIW